MLSLPPTGGQGGQRGANKGHRPCGYTRATEAGRLRPAQHAQTDKIFSACVVLRSGRA